MFTKRISAGNIFRYLAGKKDSMGRERPLEPEMTRGSARAAIDLVAAIAPRGVKPSGKQPDGWEWPANVPQKPGARPSRDWTAHCRNHMTHFISCFHESTPKVLKHLERITRSTEDLILAGLPRDSLHFTWYRHEKRQDEKGTHAHGVLIEYLLPNRKHYSLTLSRELQLQLDRLISNCLGYMDPLDPRMMRIVRGAAGSWKAENEKFITDICEATRLEVQNPDSRKTPFESFKSLLEGTPGVTLLAYPGLDGKSVSTVAGEKNPFRSYPWTMVVAHQDRPRPIYFSGPICDPKFTMEKFKAEQLLRDKIVNDLRNKKDGQKFFDRFARELKQRIRTQKLLCPDSRSERVQVLDFQWLDPRSEKFREFEADRQLSEESDRMVDWRDSQYAFVDFRLKEDSRMELPDYEWEDLEGFDASDDEEPRMEHSTTIVSGLASGAHTDDAPKLNSQIALATEGSQRLAPPRPETSSSTEAAPVKSNPPKPEPSVGMPLDAAALAREKLKRARKNLAIQNGLQLTGNHASKENVINTPDKAAMQRPNTSESSHSTIK